MGREKTHFSFFFFLFWINFSFFFLFFFLLFLFGSFFSKNRFIFHFLFLSLHLLLFLLFFCSKNVFLAANCGHYVRVVEFLLGQKNLDFNAIELEEKFRSSIRKDILKIFRCDHSLWSFSFFKVHFKYSTTNWSLSLYTDTTLLSLASI